MDLHVNRCKHQKYFWETPALLMLKINWFTKIQKGILFNFQRGVAALARSFLHHRDLLKPGLGRLFNL